MIADLPIRSLALMPSESENDPFKISAIGVLTRRYLSYASARNLCRSSGFVSSFSNRVLIASHLGSMTSADPGHWVRLGMVALRTLLPRDARQLGWSFPTCRSCLYRKFHPH